MKNITVLLCIVIAVVVINLHMYIFIAEHCSPIQFRCPYGNCINSSLTCNGVNDCPYHDNSDERGCCKLH